MEEATLRVVERCTAGSDSGGMAFPDVVAALITAGVERYHADLVRAEKTYVLPDGVSHTVRCHPLTDSPAVAFDASGVAAAVRAAQSQTVDYPGFCAAIAAAGCVGYLVSIPGRRAVYYGRTAEIHVEHFPNGD